jgi:molecular chaperone DnaK
MKADAEANAEADQLEKERVEKLNKADSLIFQTEKQIKEFEDRILENELKDLNSKLEELKKSFLEKNIEEIDIKTDELNDKWNQISTRIYSESSSNNNENTTEGNNIEDVPFEDVN